MRRRPIANVRLIERDLSGYDALAAGEQPEPLGFRRSIAYLDLVVSANLLSQVGRGVQRQFEAGRERIPDDTVEQLIAARNLPGCRACRSRAASSPTSLCVIDRNGQTREKAILMLHRVAVPEAQAAWAWPGGADRRESRITGSCIG